MALPNPLPDNPNRWEGWRNYNSSDLYARLCLSFAENPGNHEIEENCRQLLVWWQKKLPLKNQPSNPMSQMLRSALDEAPQFLAEARTQLLDPALRASHDEQLREKLLREGAAEFRKVLPFAIINGQLSPEAEARLFEAGVNFGLTQDEMKALLDEELARTGAVRVATLPPPPPAAPASAPVAAPGSASPPNPFDEFRRMLRLSRLCLDGDDMTDDQRDALCNMGESLGLTGGQAEDLIDEYLEEVSEMPGPPPTPGRATAVATKPTAAPARPAPARAVVPAAVRPAAPVPAAQPASPAPARPSIDTSAAARAQERTRYPNFRNTLGGEMRLVHSGVFFMGSTAREAAAHEQPITETTLTCFYMAKQCVTNAQFEAFDPTHRSRRARGAGDTHPVVYVNAKEAEAFCEWLSARENRKYRLPTEAEWEYAARGTDGRVFPWGAALHSGNLANFADSRTSFPWSDRTIDDGFAEAAPIGSFPQGASPFGIEDLAGNVFEWCCDFFEEYRGKPTMNPKGPPHGTKRVCRGGSWKSRASSLRASARTFNAPEYASNDVGFRVVCECE